MPLRRTTLAAGIALAAGLALTGCAVSPTPAPSPTAEGQSIATACAQVRASVQDAAARLQAIDPADPQGAVDALAGVADRLGEAMASITNADLSAALPDLAAAFETARAQLEAIAAGDLTKVVELPQAVADVQAQLTRFAELCNE